MAHPRSSIGWLLCACLACCIIHARHAHSASNYIPNDGPCKNLKSECLAWAEAGEVSEREPQLVQRKATPLSKLSHSAQLRTGRGRRCGAALPELAVTVAARHLPQCTANADFMWANCWAACSVACVKGNRECRAAAMARARKRAQRLHGDI
jgi:hypothetical protein